MFDCRFDVIAVQLDQSPVQFEWIEAAFMAV
jgi:Holliday junction resolvase-like predicted endonuclease